MSEELNKEPTAGSVPATDPIAATEPGVGKTDTTDKVVPPTQGEPVAAQEYESYGDPAADAVVSLFKEANVSPEDSQKILGDCMDTGDFSKINKAELSKKLGSAAKADLAIVGLKEYYSNAMAQIKVISDAVHTTVGGKDNFTKVQEWAKKKASADPAFAAEMGQYNQMFDLNAKSASAAAKSLMEMYNIDKANGSLIRSQIHGDKSVGGADQGTISRRDYITQLSVATKAKDRTEIDRLNNLRMNSLQQERNYRK
jgi:hypothetical protein